MDQSQPHIAKIFGTSITDPSQLPYDAEKTLAEATTYLDRDSSLDSPTEIATFARSQLGIPFPESAIDYAQRQSQTDFHTVDVKTLCYLMSGHSDWYQQQSTITKSGHTLHLYSRRAFVTLTHSIVSSLIHRSAATARRIIRLPTTLRDNQISQSIIQYLKP